MKRVLFIYIIILLTDLFSREFVLTEGEKEFLNQKKFLIYIKFKRFQIKKKVQILLSFLNR